MFSQNNTIGKIGNQVSRKFSQFGKLARGKAILAAAVAATGLCFAGNSFGAIADVQSLNATLIPGVSSVVSNVPGYGSKSSGFVNTNHYNVHYAGNDLAITKINTAVSSYVPTAIANIVLRRGSGPNNDTIWEAGTGNSKSKDLFLQGPKPTGLQQAFAGNNLLIGTDNLFSNTGNTANNNTNVERLDLMFTGGIISDPSKVFTIFDRGPASDHDAFKIAAITSLDKNGNPANYGSLLSIGEGQWGKTGLVPTQNYIVERRNNSVANDNFHPSDARLQTIGGVVIPTSDLAARGQTIYGYSLFAADVTGSGTQLVNWNNHSFFPTGTSDVENKGGLDAIGTAAVLYTAVPEPTTATLAAAGLIGLLSHRPRRNRA